MRLIWISAFVFIAALCYSQNGGRLMLRAATDYEPDQFRSFTDSTLIDSIAIHKSDREMLVFFHHELLKKYRVHLGLKPEGPKREVGDYKTPEGLYQINAKNTFSSYHKSLGISYPNENDIAEARKLGKSPGGDIVIHGLPNGDERLGRNRYRNDWTWGCIAMANQDIDELFTHVAIGIPILITP